MILYGVSVMTIRIHDRYDRFFKSIRNYNKTAHNV